MPSPASAPPTVIGLQLRHDQWHQAVLEGRVDQPLERGHALHGGGPGHRVDLEHLVQRSDVQPGDPVSVGTEPEQVRGGFGEPDTLALRQSGVAGPQIRGCRPVPR